MAEEESENDEQLLDERDRVEFLASRLILLFKMCISDIVPNLDIVKKAEKASGERADFAMSVAPILGAAGMDYEDINFEHSLRQKRSKAVADLCQVLIDTEKERKEREQKKKSNAAGFEELKRYLGT